MNRSHVLAKLLLGSALLVPATYALAQQQPVEENKTTTTTTTTETKKYLDPETKIYHEWTPAEDRAYRVYMQEMHRDFVEFPKVKVTEQTEYWKWRKGHPDSVIHTETREENK